MAERFNSAKLQVLSGFWGSGLCDPPVAILKKWMPDWSTRFVTAGIAAHIYPPKRNKTSQNKYIPMFFFRFSCDPPVSSWHCYAHGTFPAWCPHDLEKFLNFAWGFQAVHTLGPSNADTTMVRVREAKVPSNCFMSSTCHAAILPLGRWTSNFCIEIPAIVMQTPFSGWTGSYPSLPRQDPCPLRL